MSIPNFIVRCEALFASDVQPSQSLEPTHIRNSIMHTIRILGVQGCLAHVAQEFGDHPDTAVSRMRWVRQTIARTYAADADMPSTCTRRSTAVAV